MILLFLYYAKVVIKVTLFWKIVTIYSKNLSFRAIFL